MEKNEEVIKSVLSFDLEEILDKYIEDKIIEISELIIGAGKMSNWKMVDYIINKYGPIELDELLNYATRDLNFEQIKKLISYGAKNVEEPAKIAAGHDNLEILKYLIGDIENNQGWLFNERYIAKDYQNIIKSAICSESKNVINYMLEKKYKYDFNELLKISCVIDNKKLVKKFVREFKANNYEEALMTSIGFGSSKSAIWLINKSKIENFNKAFILSNITGQFLFTKYLCGRINKEIILSEIIRTNQIIDKLQNVYIKSNFMAVKEILEESQKSC